MMEYSIGELLELVKRVDNWEITTDKNKYFYENIPVMVAKNRIVSQSCKLCNYEGSAEGIDISFRRIEYFISLSEKEELYELIAIYRIHDKLHSVKYNDSEDTRIKYYFEMVDDNFYQR